MASIRDSRVGISSASVVSAAAVGTVVSVNGSVFSVVGTVVSVMGTVFSVVGTVVSAVTSVADIVVSSVTVSVASVSTRAWVSSGTVSVAIALPGIPLPQSRAIAVIIESARLTPFESFISPS